MKSDSSEWREYLMELNRTADRTYRKFRMIQYIADLVMIVPAVTDREARIAASLEFYPYILQAAMAAGDVPHDAQKQQSGFSGSSKPLEDRPGYYQFTGMFGFVSSSSDWEVASKWLYDAVEKWKSEDFQVLAVEKYNGFWEG